MTDYEAKFHAMGTPIHRCVAVKGELPPQPAESPAPAEGDKAE